MRSHKVRSRRELASVRWVWLTVGLVLFLTYVPQALAQDAPTQDEVNAVARKLFCPVCENTPLDVCPTQACQNWRDEIRVALVEGKTEQEILDEFALKYGDSVLAQPPARQWAAWVLPVAMVVAALAALVYWLQSWTRPEAVPVEREPTKQDPTIPPDDTYLLQVERELSEWEA